ncbi:CHAT domain-containing protein [Archangium gephyra]|uniref:CHAT domain-containing protein n=1 Tax=Archangium gephyra TaxID=48 RepID=A0AAC8QET2_9BACT|nr:CHAT domain-containing protein [Archangium gephyra]AKJ06146.1 Hypothetical protein AA314_07772 [Archangium gephyra]REG27101.1 CHAT domain-containing protein [Archangium gephyra]
MSRRQGNFEPQEAQLALRELLQARHIRDIARLVKQHPVLRDALFLSDLHQWLGAASLRDRSIALLLFRYLEQEAYLIHARESRSRGTSAVDKVPPYIPEYFSSIIQLLGDRLPRPRKQPLDPASEAVSIETELSKLLGSPVSLPPYQPTPGSRWAMLLVRCHGCRARRISVRPLYVDLSVVPEMRTLLSQGRLNGTRCPTCGIEVSHAVRPWLAERPWPGDQLAFLASIWRVAPKQYVYQPSIWMRITPSMSVVLESRAFQLMSELGVMNEPPLDRCNMVAFTYSHKELISRLTPSESSDLHPELELFADALCFRWEKGLLLGLPDAEEAIREVVEQYGRDWPLVWLSYTLSPEGRPLRPVVLALMSEQLGKLRRENSATRAMLAIQTAMMLLSAQRPGQSEAAFSRAEEWLAKLSSSDPLQKVVAQRLALGRSDLLKAQGRHEAAAALRRENFVTGSPDDPSWEGRASHWVKQSIEALDLHHAGNRVGSLEAFVECILHMNQLLSEAISCPELPQAAVVLVLSTFSGTLANCAAVLIAADKEWSAVAESDMESRLSRCVASLLKYARQLPSWEGELDWTEDASLQRKLAAARLLFGALELSVSLNEWRFSAVQAGHLTRLLLDGLRLTATAEQHAWRWLKFAHDAGAQIELGWAELYLARIDLGRGNGAGALDHLEAAARYELRELASRGHDETSVPFGRDILELTFESIEAGADASRAVILAESLKAARTALDVESGPLGRRGKPLESIQTRLEQLSREREGLRSQLPHQDPPEREQDEAQLLRVEREIARLQEALALRDPAYMRRCESLDLHLSTPEGIRNRLRALGPGATYLGLLVVPSGLWTYAFWDSGCSVACVSWVELEEDLKALDGLNDWTEHQDTPPEALRSLSEKLISPHAARLRDMSPSDRLILSPTQGFFHVPFGMLPFEGKELARLAVISYVQGAGLFESCFERRPSAPRSVLCIGMHHRRGSSNTLPFARDEVKQLEHLLREAGLRTCTLLDEEATVPAVLARSAEHDVLHFACHGYWLTDKIIRRPYLELEMTLEGDSGELTDWRIMGELLLRPGTLVNLSACKSALQIESGAEVRDGLVPAFLLAKAGGVLATLWRVEDACTLEFQAEFYRRLISGEAPADALASTVRACMDGALGPRLANPSLWAAFVFYGVG